jgi:hypothetical protein
MTRLKPQELNEIRETRMEQLRAEFGIRAEEEWRKEEAWYTKPLTEVPRTEEEINWYDVIVWGDVDPTRFTNETLGRYRDFVKKHRGGMIFQAGEWFTPNELRNRPLEELLPVRLDRLPTETRINTSVSQGFKLTTFGIEEPLLRLVPNASENRTLWEGNQRSAFFFYWFRPVLAHASSKVYATHADPQFGEIPLLASRTIGEGSAFYVGIDELWKTRRFRGDRYYWPIWYRLIRYCAEGRLTQRHAGYDLWTDKRTYSPGEKITVAARILADRYPAAIMAGADGSRTVEVAMQNLHLKAFGEDKVEKFELRVDESPDADVGESVPTGTSFKETIQAMREGRYAIWLTAIDDSQKNPHIFFVQEADVEFVNPGVDEATLRKVADPTNGYYDLASLRDLTLPKREQDQVMMRKQQPLWQSWLLLVVMALLLTIEWIARKTYRLL